QIAVTQAMRPLLRRARGRIVNMSSIGGRQSVAFLGPYSASKFALEAATDALRQELSPWGLHVVAIEPGTVATPIWDKAGRLADEQMTRLPAAMHDLYGTAIQKVRSEIDDAHRIGAAPERVARTVGRALTARRPKTRYV